MRTSFQVPFFITIVVPACAEERADFNSEAFETKISADLREEKEINPQNSNPEILFNILSFV
jgi:hypothetical protein